MDLQYLQKTDVVLLDPKRDTQEGFKRLKAINRLDLSVEYLILQKKWRSLFSISELNVARSIS